jgi:hypothetical protein
LTLIKRNDTELVGIIPRLAAALPSVVGVRTGGISNHLDQSYYGLCLLGIGIRTAILLLLWAVDLKKGIGWSSLQNRDTGLMLRSGILQKKKEQSEKMKRTIHIFEWLL